MKTPISIISGYLGAGKTTLLKKIISNLDRKFAIIMNEFGEVGIDTQILQGKNVNISELAGGCVCCSLTGEFEEAVKEIIQKYSPEIIIVETTGVAEPDALVIEITDQMPELALDTVIAVADTDALVRFPNIGRTGSVQLEMADIILMNKIDLVKPEQLTSSRAKIRQCNKKAPIIETSHCDVDIDLLFGTEIEHHISAAHHTHDNPFQSFVLKIEKPITRERLENFLLKLTNKVYRVKGFITLEEEGQFLVNYVAGRWELEPMQGKDSSLVFIGQGIEKIKLDIESSLTN